MFAALAANVLTDSQSRLSLSVVATMDRRRKYCIFPIKLQSSNKVILCSYTTKKNALSS